MDILIKPAPRISGQIKLPGDKSISHRLAMLGAIANGTTQIENFATSQDCHSTLSCLRLLGVEIKSREETRVSITGRGLRGLKASVQVLDAGNSGSTIRMLSGILAGQNFETRISGDESLQRRPMHRVIIPLTQMGARIEARDSNFPPLYIQGGVLKPIQYTLPVASAQVKSAILLAGLYGDGKTKVTEPTATRNHTELALRSFGGAVETDENKISINGGQTLQGVECSVPGDISSAAFFIAAATLLPGSEILIERAGLNPGRRGIIDLLQQMGASIELLEESVQGGEPVGSLRIKSADLKV